MKGKNRYIHTPVGNLRIKKLEGSEVHNCIGSLLKKSRHLNDNLVIKVYMCPNIQGNAYFKN